MMDKKYAHWDTYRVCEEVEMMDYGPFGGIVPEATALINSRCLGKQIEWRS